MIESRVGTQTPKLDQLKTDIVLGLQELQDQVAKHGRLWNFAYESRLRWERDNDGYGYQIEWSPIDGKISFASGDAERREKGYKVEITAYSHQLCIGRCRAPRGLHTPWLLVSRGQRVYVDLARGEIGVSGSLTYLDRVWEVLNSVVKYVLRDLHSKLPL